MRTIYSRSSCLTKYFSLKTNHGITYTTLVFDNISKLHTSRQLNGRLWLEIKLFHNHCHKYIRNIYESQRRGNNGRNKMLPMKKAQIANTYKNEGYTKKLEDRRPAAN